MRRLKRGGNPRITTQFFIARQINKAMARGLLVKKSYGKYEAGPKLRGLEGETESKAGA